jgi:hypothetical protein
MTEPALGVILQGAAAVDPTLLTVMQWAVIVAAAAIVIQTILLFAMFLASRAMRQQVQALAEKVEPVSDSAKRTLESAQTILSEVRGYARDYSAKGNEILELTRKQLARADEVLAEAATRSRAQMDRVEMVIDDTVSRFQETTTLLQNGIVKPLRQVAGITAGVRTAMNAIFRGRRATVEQATHDEEMFI